MKLGGASKTKGAAKAASPGRDKPKGAAKAGSQAPPAAVAPASAGAHAIDALFDLAKRKKNSKAEEGKDADAEEPVVSKKKAKMASAAAPAAAPAALPYGILKSNIEQITNPEAPVERVDPESGYRVYKAHLLKVGEGGGTELCPFDCNCCF